ncbi:MAG: coagulation factor 5/8 type domain-containing protein, partial [Acidobacteriota bacterium]|nr:coagulation factor 5/8 type domain-containing protein [Acidobacteriota bacterium]
MRTGLLAAGLWLGMATAGFAAEAGMAPQWPQMGPNVLIFTPQMKAADVQAAIDRVYREQEHSEFGGGRYALVFLPGTYRVDVPVGFYTEVVGLGATPDAVQIVGNVHADASLPHNNATCTFWRSLEGLAVTPAGGTMQWAVSQAAPFRRMHVEGSMVLHQQHGWASGGWMADVLVDGNVDSGTQQQWMARNSAWGSWTGANWNMVFVGDRNAPTGEWPKPPYTKVAATPVVREKPFLMVDGKGAWSVRVPALRRESVGNTWGRGETPGQSIPLGRFYIAQAGKDTAATMNAALGRGMHLLLTPGIYELEQPLRVTRAGTVVLGLGFATLKPVKGTAALTTADVDGVDIAGVLVDAGETRSPVLMRVGEAGSKRSHAANPICLHDVFFRVGGAGAGSAGVNLEVNSRDTIIDHTWIWRADHGKGVGWTVNPSDNGLVVN